MQKMIKQGDTLNILIEKTYRNQIGSEILTQEAVIQISYEQLLATFYKPALVRAKQGDTEKHDRAKPNVKTRNIGPAYKFGKSLDVAIYRILHGKHKNQLAPTKPKAQVMEEAVNSILNAFRELPVEEYKNISSKDWEKLKDLKTNRFGLSTEQTYKLMPVFTALEV